MNPFQIYFNSLCADFKTGYATEHTYRPALKTLIESFRSDISATNEPRRIECGAPDFIICSANIPIGYIEAKNIHENLDKAENSEQLGRYRESLSNLILSDYLEFRWYARNSAGESEHRLTARLAEIRNNKLTLVENGISAVSALFDAFLNADIPIIASPKELAQRMAKSAKLICATIETALLLEKQESDQHPKPLTEQMESFKSVLLKTLTPPQLADMYAQTICYGMFAARCHAKQSADFSRSHAASLIPKTNPFLQKLFDSIAGIDLDDRIAWVVDDLAQILNCSDMAAILKDFGKMSGKEDAVVHFYETFLISYDSNLRETRGVYYTPEPVVSYMVKSVDLLLKKEFGIADGLADSSTVIHPKTKEEIHKVLILDPAVGTGTFLYSVMTHIHKIFQGDEGAWSDYVKKHLLPRIFGFELLMSPYSVAHLKLGLLLSQTGYKFDSDERLRIYLTNTLDEPKEVREIPFSKWIAEEAKAAGSVKQNAPVMVILGNPPYSGHSANSGEWLENLLHHSPGHYFQSDGKLLNERNPKWLNDDYVKFMRFAQWRIEQTGYGILAFITNHGYLDNPTFRGMRQSLMNTFDDIYILDLHGNSKKKEKQSNGLPDENVFDIQQGTAICFMIKRTAG